MKKKKKDQPWINPHPNKPPPPPENKWNLREQKEKEKKSEKNLEWETLIERVQTNQNQAQNLKI